MKIYPAILTDSIEQAQEQLDIVMEQPDIETVQLDVIDGFFTDNLTITPIDLPDLEFEQLQADLHLMVTEPLDFVFEVVSALDTERIRAVISQVEQMSNQAEYLEEVKKHGWLAGLSLDRFTPVEAIDDDSWQSVDIIQLMTIEAGTQGQVFQPAVLEKVAEIKAKIAEQDRAIELIIDGGVKLENLSQLADLELDGAAIGSAIWQAPEPVEALGELCTVAQNL